MASPSLSLKRKTKPSSSSIAKRVKTKHVLTEDLPWKKVSKPREADLGTGMDGFLELEEVDDVDVVYEETDAGRVVKFQVRAVEDEEMDEAGAEAGQSSEAVAEKVDVDALPEPVVFDGMCSRWIV